MNRFCIHILEYSLFIAIVLTFCVPNLMAQYLNRDKVLPDSCESIAAKLDVVGLEFSGLKNKNSVLHVIGQAAQGEKTKYLNNRFKKVEWYLKRFHKIQSKRIVLGIRFAHKKKADRHGSLRFYVAGEEAAEIRSRKKGGICFGAN